MRKTALAFLAVALCACGVGSDFLTKCDKEFEYCLQLSQGMEESSWKNSNSFSGIETAHTASNGAPFDRLEAVRIEVFHDTTCPNLAINNPREIKGAEWGEVDMNAFSPYLLGPYPICRPPKIILNDCGEAGVNPDPKTGVDKNYEECMKDFENAPDVAAYAFCAEKDDKAVVLCIQQMTNNEDAARTIFESFRWTEE